MEAEELFLGEGNPSTSEAGFSLSQTLTLSQHGLGVHPKTPKIVADRLSYLVTHEFVEQDFLSAPDSTPSETSDGFPQTGKQRQIVFEVSAQTGKCLQMAFEVFPQVGKRVQIAFEVFPQVGKWVQIAFEVFPQVGKWVQIAFEVFPQTGKWVQIAFAVFPQVGKWVQSVFEVFPQVGKWHQIAFEVSAQVGKWLQMAFDTSVQWRVFERSGVLGQPPQAVLGKVGGLEGGNPRFRVEGFPPSKSSPASKRETPWAVKRSIA
ncbi:MAG: hypothetical protein HDR32_05525 [Treponema sp.]|nr:hypothetical protein [Treponema sp.]